ncbi:hypothetical protein [Aquisalimonas asiatica]|uniref:Antitoxin Xre/MbcA/ParS-like toxin-binding domain-containing protein n=1 Tax=Aquisalimonas asiatica TaxID=406100 RepID=A0A1H8S4D6_9GAMM|nr:hypothetical protein [Aquisalimonas asiatica]SEO73188.1 hypothetical protein SAMN04488052_102451 [Aquisalimonas asiatica]
MNVDLDTLTEAASAGDITTLSAGLRTTASDLAAAIGAEEAQLVQPGRPSDQVTQRLEALTRILTTTQPWAGSWGDAWHWYRNTPISALGGVSAATLVASGESDRVEQYLAHIGDGGYA